MTPTVAYAEDEPDLAEAVAEYLTHAGFAVIVAHDGPGLRQAVAGQRVDVALLDVMMPGEDGLALAQWIKAQGPVGVIMATALGRTVDRVAGLESGADDYVVKPYDLAELAARLRRVAARYPGAEMPGTRIVAPAGARLDAERRAVIAGEAAVVLSEAEFALVQILADRRGRPMPREDLAHALSIAGDLRSVDVRVARIRKKLSSIPVSNVRIETLRGEGYCLILR